jgi:F-type H+-transporting ATPase subunit b
MGALLTPALGTVVWASLAFLVVLFVLRRFAWGPILTALNDREQSIAGALNEAEKVRKEMEALAASNENQLKEARAQRDQMMREAREMADQLVADAKKSNTLN